MALLHNVFILTLLSLSASCLPDPVQNPETVFKRNTGEDGDQEEKTIQTQIDQLYQIYQATQNNIIQLNTEISLFNEQLANLRDTVKTLKTGVSSDVVKLVSDVGTLKNNLKEIRANMSELAETVTKILTLCPLNSVMFVMQWTLRIITLAQKLKLFSLQWTLLTQTEIQP